MRKLIVIALLVIATVASAEVLTGTLYEYDALRVNYGIMESGFDDSDFQVFINRADGNTNYLIAWDGEHYNPDYDDQDVFRLMASLSMAGAVSSSTSWSSDFIGVGFDNKMFICSTSAARRLVRDASTMDVNDYAAWMLVNITVSEY